MRLVLDTDVMVAALRSVSGASRQLLIAVDRRYTLVISVPLMLEWEAVLKRPRNLRAASLDAKDIDTILDELASSVPLQSGASSGGRRPAIRTTRSSSRRQ